MNTPRVAVELVVEYLQKHITASNADLIDRFGCSPRTITEARRAVGLTRKSANPRATQALNEAQDRLHDGGDLGQIVREVAAAYGMNAEQRYRLRANLVERERRLHSRTHSSMVGEMMAGELSKIWLRRAWR